VSDGVSALGSLRVVLEVGAFPLTGQPFSVVARDAASGGVKASTMALPEDGYRYVFADLKPGSYVIHAGTDLDSDGFFCEANDWCGDHGGATPADIDVTAGSRVRGVDIVLRK
jgi:serine protease